MGRTREKTIADQLGTEISRQRSWRVAAIAASLTAIIAVGIAVAGLGN